MSLSISPILGCSYYTLILFIFAMGILKRLLMRCIYRRRSKNLSSLERLPNEILRHIDTFLPLPAAVAFALCSVRLYFVLGNSSWVNLIRTEDQLKRERKCKGQDISCSSPDWRDPPAQGEREELIALLEKDLPKLIFCCECALLHRPDHHYETWTRMCSCTGWTVLLTRNLPFTSIQMAMKLFRLGREYKRQLEKLSYHDISPSYLQPYYDDNYSMCTTREARIAHGNFLVRNQEWFILPAGSEGLPPGPRGNVQICRHVNNTTRLLGGTIAGKATLGEMINCLMSHWTQQDLNCPKCSDLQQCPFCETEFQIDIRQLGARGFTLVISSWWNLDPGFSPYDVEFKTHFVWPLRVLEPQVLFAAGSIRGSFENHEDFSIDSLFEKYLCGRVLTLNRSKFIYRRKSV